MCSSLLYGVEACPFLVRVIHSLDFSLTHIFMKLFRTGSAVVVTECQKLFSFLPLRYQFDIRTASFMLRFMASDNSICNLFDLEININITVPLLIASIP